MPHSNSLFKDYFKILQVDPEAEGEIITAAYYALMKKYHPDKNKESLEYSKDLNEAYEILSHPEKKQQYLIGFKQYSAKNNHFVKEVPPENAYYNQRGILNRKADALEAKEAELKKKELAINMKLKLMEEMHRFSEHARKNADRLDYKTLLEQFYKGTLKEAKAVLEDIFSLGEKELLALLEKLFSTKIEMEKELLLYQKLLKSEIAAPYEYLEGAFKYKELYPELLELIERRKQAAFKVKISALVRNTSFKLGNNMLLLPVLLDIYRWLFDRESQLELLVKVQVLLEQKKIPSEIKEGVTLKFLQYLLDLDCAEYFQEALKVLEKEKHPLIEQMLKKVKAQV